MTKLILLVEDNPDDQVLTKSAFQMTGVDCDVKIFAEGQDCLDYIFCEGRWLGRDIDPRPDLILLDINMPKVDGFTVLELLRKSSKCKYVPIVMLTTSTDIKDIAKSYELGANSFIRKPVNFDDFSEAAGQISKYWLTFNQAFD
jgi:two-component system response regulator